MISSDSPLAGSMSEMAILRQLSKDVGRALPVSRLGPPDTKMAHAYGRGLLSKLSANVFAVS